MADTFDPYYKWLGIPPREQPPHHYRLLGVALWEADGDVIQNAADRQMAHLRTFQSGAHSALSQRLLNELAAARVCLLDPRRKAAYDETLRGQQAPRAVPLPVAALPLSGAVAAETVASVADDAADEEELQLFPPRPRLGRQLRRRQRGNGQVLFAGGTVVLVLAVAVLALVFGRGGDEIAQEESKDREAAAVRPETEPAGELASEQTPNSRPAASGDRQRSEPESLTAPVDLLARVELPRDSVAGVWKSDDNGLVSPGKLGDRLQLPFPLPAEYTVELQGRRESGQDGIGLGVVVGGRQVLVVLDSWNGANSGLNLIDGAPETANETTYRGKLFDTGRTFTAVCTVRRDAVHVAVDDRTIIDWQGEAERLSLDGGYAVPDKRALFLANLSDSTYRITKLELRPADAVVESPPDEPPSGDGPIDLLAAVDPARDAPLGVWRKGNGELLSPRDTAFARIVVPQRPPAAYVMQLEVERLPGSVGTKGLVVGLVAEERQFALVIDHEGSSSGLHALDNLPFNDQNPTLRNVPRLKVATRGTVLCTVRPGRVLVLIDGQTVVDWKGRADQLALASSWHTPQPGRLFLGTNGAFRITRWTLTPREVSAAELAATPASATASPGESPADGSSAEGSSTERPPRTGTLADLLRPENKAPQPDDANVRAAELRIKARFANDFSRAKSPAEQTALARKLADEALQAAQASEDQYALFALAAEIAADAGQFNQANDALNALYRRFDADVLALKEAALNVAAGARYVKAPADHRAVAVSWVLLVNEAIVQDRYEAAERFARLAVASARKANDKIYLGLVVEGNKKVQQAVEAYESARIARQTLESNPDDPAAGRVWGRFCCLVKNDWDRGLPFLAHASEDRLSSLAARDMQKPREAPAQAALADAWWEASEREPESLPKRMLLLRAVHWYNQALPRLSGLAAVRARDRVDESDLSRNLIPLNEWVDVLGMVDPVRHTVAGEWARQGSEIGTLRKRQFARFLLPVAPEASYELEVRFTIAEGTEVDLVLPVGDRGCTLVLGGWNGSASGLHTIDNVQARDNATAVKPSGLTNDRSYKLTVRVEVNGADAAIAVELNDRPYLSWEGKRASLGVTREYALPRPGAVALGAWDSMAVFHAARLRLRSGGARVLLD